MRKLKIKFRRVIIGAVTGTLLAAALVLSAFAFAGDETGSSSRVVEEMDGSGSYITAQAASLDAVGTDGVTANPLNEEGVSDDALSEEEITRTVELLGANKDYLASMTPEEIQSLSAEALQNEGLDTSLADGGLTTRGITFELPEGFIADPDYPGMYVTERYPIDASNMVYSEFDVDYTLQMMNEEYFEEMVEQMFASRYGYDIDVVINEFTSYQVDGVPALRVKAGYDLEGNHVTSLMIIINGSKTYTVIYTQNQDYDRMELFEASASSIHVQK